jgi:hypothetical protein
MKFNNAILKVVVIFLSFVLTQIIPAQIVVQNSVFSNGSAQVGDGNHLITAIVGQPVIGTMSNSTHASKAGMWYLYEHLVVTKVENTLGETPTSFRLEQNYPNPFNPTTTIQFAIPKMSEVTLKLYDVLGRKVATLVEEEMPQGVYKIDFDARDLPSGVYVYRIQAEDFSQLKKFLLLK